MHAALHKYNSDIATYTMQLIRQIQRQTGKKLKHIHSDGGSEICTDVFAVFCAEEGILHTTTIPNTPQHNSIVERKGRSIINKTSATMHHAKAWLPLFGERIMAIVYIENRTTNTRTERMTPIEHRTGRKPSVKHVHVWGCDVFYHNHKTR